MIHRAVPWILSCGLAVAPLAAHAQGSAASGPDASSAPRTEANTRFTRGVELFNEGNYAAALIEFRRAYDLAPDYRVLYNMGQVCYQLQDYVCALKSFEQYLSEGADVPAERRAAVEQDVAHLRARVARLTIETNVPDAEIAIDDVSVGRTPLKAPIPVSAGRRRVTAVRYGRLPITRSVDVAGGDALTVHLDLAEIAPAAPPTPRAATPPAGESDGQWTTLSWVGIGTSGALAAAGGITGLLALSAASDAREGHFASEAAAGDRQSRARTLAAVSDLLMATAAVTLGVTLVLTLTRSTRPAATVSIGAVPAGFAAHGTF